MSSKASQQTTTKDETQNIAIDRRAVQEAGTQVLDSIVYDTSAESVRDVMQGLEAAWETSVRGNSLNLIEVLDMGQQVLKLADDSQVKLEGIAYQTLKNGLDQFEGMMRNGEVVVDFADALTARALAANTETTGAALDANESIAQGALDVVASVQTGDFSSNLKSISFAVMGFALIAIYLSKKD